MQDSTHTIKYNKIKQETAFSKKQAYVAPVLGNYYEIMLSYLILSFLPFEILNNSLPCPYLPYF